MIKQEKLEKIAKRFRGIGLFLLHFFPFLRLNLKQAEIKTPAEIYILTGFLTGLTSFSFLSVLLFFIFLIGNALTINNIIISFLVAFCLGAMQFLNFLFKPKVIVAKKNRTTEKNLLFSMRHLLIELRSGVPLFNAIVSVSQGDYGSISDEFKRVIRETNAGVPLVNSLDKMAARSPSSHMRRVLWQLTNSLKAGSDITRSIEEIVKNLAQEQKVAIRNYGSQLNPMALVYMMFAIILPSLGVTFLMVLSTFSGFFVNETIFYAILIFLIIFQFAFLGVVKSRRPFVEM